MARYTTGNRIADGDSRLSNGSSQCDSAARRAMIGDQIDRDRQNYLRRLKAPVSAAKKAQPAKIKKKAA